jgi:outer membrane protein assembly factor BamB
VLRRAVEILIITLFSTAAVAALGWWLTLDGATDVTASLPGMDGAPERSRAADAPVVIGEFFRSFDGRPSTLTGAWPRFRGSRYDAIAVEGPPLIDEIPAGGLPVLWTVDLGEGHAGAAVANGRVYLLDYDEQAGGDSLRCFSLDDGAEIWRRWYRLQIKRNHGRSRTVPAVTDRFVVTMGPECHVMCVDSLSGDLLWTLDLRTEYGVEVPLWYTGQCPLIRDDVAVIAVGGDVLMVGIDCATGEVIWETPNPDNLAMSHSSVMPMTLDGRLTYVYVAVGGIVGIDPQSGRRLWASSDFDATVIAPSPVHLGGGRIFATAGYGAGSILIDVQESEGRFDVRTISKNRPNEGFACEQQTPIVHRGLLYGILPKDAGPLRNQFVCWDPDGGLVWSSGEAHRYGLGPSLLADGRFLILSDEGVLTFARADAAGFEPVGTAQILNGRDSWAPLALVEGRLLARDSLTMVCLDLRK